MAAAPLRPQAQVLRGQPVPRGTQVDLDHRRGLAQTRLQVRDRQDRPVPAVRAPMAIPVRRATPVPAKAPATAPRVPIPAGPERPTLAVMERTTAPAWDSARDIVNRDAVTPQSGR